MTLKTTWTIIKEGVEYECEVSFEASTSSIYEVSINQVSSQTGLDIDPEIFQSKLTPEEEADLYKDLNNYADDLSQYHNEDML